MIFYYAVMPVKKLYRGQQESYYASVMLSALHFPPVMHTKNVSRIWQSLILIDIMLQVSSVPYWIEEDSLFVIWSTRTEILLWIHDSLRPELYMVHTEAGGG